MTSIIKTSVLRAAVLSAFDMGRYTVQFGTRADGDDIAVVPASIALDLAERDDDLLGAETDHAQPTRDDIGKWKPFMVDEHGPAVPAQDFSQKPTSPPPVLHEFAIQDTVAFREGNATQLSDILPSDDPDLDAGLAADWVYVYDRDTRERRTLKRPTDDAVVEGFQILGEGMRLSGSWARSAPFGSTQAESLTCFFPGRWVRTRAKEAAVTHVHADYHSGEVEKAFHDVLSGGAEREGRVGKWRVYRDGGRVVFEDLTVDSTTPKGDA